MKLAVKITLVGIIVMATVIGSLLTIAIITSQNGLEKRIGESQVQLSKSAMAQIDRELFHALQSIRAMAEDEEFEGAVVGEDFTGSNQKLRELSSLTGPWDELEIFNSDGEVAAAVDVSAIGESLEDSGTIEKEAFQVAITGELYHSELVISDATGKPTIIFAAPIKSKTRQHTGVVVGHYAWPVIQDILFAMDVEHAHLYNKEGFLLASNQPTDAQNILREQDSRVIQHYQEHGDSFNIGLSNEGTFEALQSHVGQKGHLTYKGRGWVLLLETPTNVAFASVQKATRGLLFAGFIVMILTVLFSFSIARSITRPLIAIKESAEKISHGNLGETIEYKGNDEISALADSFDTMRYSLKMVIEEYEKIKGSGELVEELQAAQQKYKVIFDNTNDAIMVFNVPDYLMVDFNMATQLLLGYSTDELSSMTLSQLYPKDKSKEMDSVVKQCINGLRKGIITVSLVTKNKQVVEVAGTISMIILDGQEAILANFRKVSETDKHG